MNIIALILSAALHLAAVLVATMPGCVGAGEKSPEKGEHPVQVKPEKPGNLEFVKAGTGDKIHCPKWYAGVGLLTNWSGFVTELAPGGPAELAGIRVGDNMLNASDFGRDRYPAGTVMPLTYLHDGIEHTIQITIGRVCYDE